MNMKTSANGLQFLKNEEGMVLHIYKDKAGLPTIGIGHLLTKFELASHIVNINGVPVSLTGGITEQQALDLLAQDMGRFEDVINSYVKTQLTQNQFDAMESLSYNIGDGGFEQSSALVAINAGKFDEVPADIMKWNKITVNGQHVVDEELTERRAREVKLWNGQV